MCFTKGGDYSVEVTRLKFSLPYVFPLSRLVPYLVLGELPLT